jgi:hypothetical protein
LTILQNLSVSFDLLYSPEGSSSQRQINQFALHPKWGWGAAHVGDFSHHFSNFTLSGVTIRGVGIELYPQLPIPFTDWKIPVRWHMVGGRSQQAMESGPYSSTYARYLGAMKLGFGGMEGGGYLDLHIVRVKDDVNSLPQEVFNPSNTGSPTGITGVVTGTIRPQENLVLGLSSFIPLFQGRLTFRGEATGSAFSRDLFSPTITFNGLSSAVNGIYSLRLSSNADYAYTGEVGLSIHPVSLFAKFTQVGPGYVSLGVPSLINDYSALQGSLGLQLFGNRLSLQGGLQLQRDNVVSQKLFTTSRNTFSLAISTRPFDRVSIGFNGMENIITSDAQSESLRTNNVVRSLSANANFQFNVMGLEQSLSTSYVLQASEDLNITRRGHGVTSNNVGGTLTTRISRLWSVSTGISYTGTDIQSQGLRSMVNMNCRLNGKFLNSRLSSSTSLDYSTSETSRITNVSAQASYPITRDDILSTLLRASSFRSTASLSSGFTDYSGSLSYAHRF